jgi:hypothetical protein
MSSPSYCVLCNWYLHGDHKYYNAKNNVLSQLLLLSGRETFYGLMHNATLVLITIINLQPRDYKQYFYTRRLLLSFLNLNLLISRNNSMLENGTPCSLVDMYQSFG